MTLKQFAVIPFPFMGQFISLAQIASRASDNKVTRIIRSATRQRDNVIDVVDRPDVFFAPITATILRFVLSIYIGLIELAICTKCSSASSPRTLPIDPRLLLISHFFSSFHFVWMLTAIMSCMINTMLMIAFIRCSGFISFAVKTIVVQPVFAKFIARIFFESFYFVAPAALFSVICSLQASSFGLSDAIAAFAKKTVFPVPVSIKEFQSSGMNIAALCAPLKAVGNFGRSLWGRLALFANRTQTVVVMYTKELAGGGFILAAFRTAFRRGIHSVSLSLYRMMMSADGVICRRFGYPLADLFITPQKAVIWL